MTWQGGRARPGALTAHLPLCASVSSSVIRGECYEASAGEFWMQRGRGNPVTLLVAGNNPFMTLRDLSARSLERGQWK